MLIRQMKRVVRRTLDTQPWRPGHASLVLGHLVDRRRNQRRATSDQAYIAGAAQWIARAQDVAGDGGVMGRYRLNGGWTSSYPETTGYIIPTLLDLEQDSGDRAWRARAARCVDFLLAQQLPVGAFPGGEVHENTGRLSVFNTGQIINGLTSWYTSTGDERTLAALRRAGDWMCDVQDADGAWRRHVYNDVATTYTAHASCWLAELGERLQEPRYIQAAVRHMDWVLSHRDPGTGWIDLMGFYPEDHQARHSVTHTIAYTYWGILHTAAITEREDAIDAVAQAAVAIARRVQLSGWLPGVLNHEWKAQASYACLTGNAQMACIWLRLYERSGDGRLLNAALIALDRVKDRQLLDNSDPGIRGGIAGSWPVWGDYMYAAYPNWAAKFFIDAMRSANRIVDALPHRRVVRPSAPAGVPVQLPAPSKRGGGAALRFVLLAGPHVHKVAQMVTSWRELGFRPAAVVVQRPPGPSIWRRIGTQIRNDGLWWIADRIGGHRAAAANASGDADVWDSDVLAFCAREGIPVVEVASLSSPDGVSALRALHPDLCIHAGAGILRAETLEVPRLGTLNAHMGRLPAYRGMNVAEWAVFNRDDTGCSVHLVNRRIDLGDILCTERVDRGGRRSLAEVRRSVDDAQIALLGRTIEYVLATGELPPRFAQADLPGRQYFRMHPRLRAVLDAELASAQ